MYHLFVRIIVYILVHSTYVHTHYYFLYIMQIHVVHIDSYSEFRISKNDSKETQNITY